MPTSGFTQAGVYARRQFCGNLEVCRLQNLCGTPACGSHYHVSGNTLATVQQNNETENL